MNAELFLNKVWKLKDKPNFKRIIDEVEFNLPFYITTKKSALIHQDGQLQASMSMVEYEKDKLYLGKIIGDGERGRVLSHFSKIEFILDAMILLGEGVYINPMKYGKVKNFWIDDESITAAKKIKYARYHNFISSETRNLLWKAKDVRNILSHQYLPDLALTSSLKRRLLDNGVINIGKGVETLMLDSWVSLLNDYEEVQQPIVDYVSNRWII